MTVSSQVSMEESIQVRVVAPGNARTVSVDGGRNVTVGEVLAEAGIASAEFEVRMGGNRVEETEVVTNGQTIVLAKRIKGNFEVDSQLSVRVVAPGNARTVVLESADGVTVAEVLTQAEIDYEQFEIRMGGCRVEVTEVVTPGQTIVLAKRIKGNFEVDSQLSVRVVAPGNARTVVLESADGVTVAEVLTQAEIDYEQFEIRMGGCRVDVTEVVTAGQTIVLAKRIKGN